jgi:phospholipid N-methyltransferase
MEHTATYSPEDNSLRLYPAARLDADEYARVKAAGFKWAPKQELFVAHMWTPSREDLLLDMCGDIGDEDSSLVDRAETRAERFEEYSDKRGVEADRAHEAVAAIADNIPLGQPILVGHHSEKHARRDAEKIRSGMNKAIRLWETSKYWTARAAGAIQHAKYKERPDVRHRRIKGIESDKRKTEKTLANAKHLLSYWSNLHDDSRLKKKSGEPSTVRERALFLANSCHFSQCFPLADFPRDPPASQYEGQMGIWSALDGGVLTPEQARDILVPSYSRSIASCERWLSHYDNRLAYERAMLAESLGEAAGETGDMAGRFDLQVGGRVVCRREREWLTILRINRADGKVNSITTTAPRAVTWARKWKYGIEEIQQYEPPSQEQKEAAKAATKLAPICNYPGDGFHHMTKAEWDAKHKDYKCLRDIAATTTTGKHRVRHAMLKGYKTGHVYLTDQKTTEPPKLSEESLFEPPAGIPPAAVDSPSPPATISREPLPGYAAPQPRADRDNSRDASFLAMKEGLRHGVQVVSAPQLFPTPQAVAERMAELAGLEAGQRVLEPSAGTGALVDVARRSVVGDLEMVAMEINHSLAKALAARWPGVSVINADFLDCAGVEKKFDRVLMNPPFLNAIDIKHILHARRMLKPNGRLVALCANGPRQRDALQSIATHWEDLPAGSFKEAGTNVNVALLVLDGPGDSAEESAMQAAE